MIATLFERILYSGVIVVCTLSFFLEKVGTVGVVMVCSFVNWLFAWSLVWLFRTH